jgi:succinylglutamate desuccinylase
MDTAIVVCLHGNELFGLDILDRLSGRFSVYLGNPLAITKKTRFIDEDLNRAFPGNINGNYEQKRADNLLKKLKGHKQIIDVHSSSSNIELFGILTNPKRENIDLAKKLGLKKVVIITPKFADKKALIDYVDCGISLEVGPHGREENVQEIINAIENLDKDNLSDPEIFEVFDIIKSEEENLEPQIENFKAVKKGDLIAKGAKEYYAQEDFIPVFVGEESYKGILCLAIKKININ